MTSSRLGPRITLRAFLILALSVIFIAPTAFAQLPQGGDTTSTPTAAPGHDYLHSPVETVDPANGSVSIRVPVRIPQGRQLTVPFSFAYDSNGGFYIGLPSSGSGGPNYYSTSATYSQGGWSYTFPMLTYQEINWTVTPPPPAKPYPCSGLMNYVFQDPQGNRHNLGLAVAPTSGPGGKDCATGPDITQGGEGAILATTTNPAWAFESGPPVTVTDGNGTVYAFPSGSITNTGAYVVPTSITDRNGNSAGIGVDDIGRTVVSPSVLGVSGNPFAIGGLSSPYKLYWTTASASFTDNMLRLQPLDSPCPTAMSGSNSPISEILLPNGQQFTFTYDPTYGMLTKIVYPSGGYVRYVWGLNSQAEVGEWTASNGAAWECRYDFPAITDRYVSFDGSTEVLHQHFAYTTTWPGNGPLDDGWTTKTTTVTTTDNVRNTSFATVYTYLRGGSPGVPNPNPDGSEICLTCSIPLEQEVQYYATTNTNLPPLRTVTKSWYNIRLLRSEQTTLDNNQSSLKVNCYNTNEELTETDEYDLGTSTPTLPTCASGVPSGTVSGSLLRKTTTSYASFTPHIVDLPSTVITYDGSGNRVGETDSSSYDTHGNLLTQTKDCFALPSQTACSQGNSTVTYTYDSNGQILTMVDANGNESGGTPSAHTTSYSYTDSYTSCSGAAPPHNPSDAYLTQVTYPPTNGVNHVVSYCYDYTKGVMLSSADENSQTTTYAYADTLDRLTQATYPDGGQTTYSYNDAGPSPTETATKKLNSSQSITTVSTMNGLGDIVQTQLTSDPQGTITTKKTLDGVGRDYTVYNPYRSTSDPTYGYVTYVYDALGRTTSVTKPDNSVVTTAYCGQDTLVTDEASHWRRSATDGLGRLIEVDEPNSTTATVNSNGCQAQGDPIWVTTYTHDALNNLTAVVQGSSRNRSFTYDSLKHLTQSANPESGTIKYTYDPNGNVITKVDARNLTTNYSPTASPIDALNRVTEITYSDGVTPTVSYVYDQSACLGQSSCYNIGHRTTMTDAGGSENLAYDKMGRELVEQRTTNSVTKSTTYTYDLAGDLATLTYPTGRMITYTYDSAGRPSEAQDVANSINYALGTCANGLSSNGVCYAPQGAVSQIKNGTNLVSTYLFNTRLQPCWMYATTGTALATNTLCTATDSTPGNILDLKYCFYTWSSGACQSSITNNGNVIGITNNRTTARTQTFTYDQVNRIVTGETTSTTGSNCWGETYTLDQWANLTAIGAVSGYTGCTQENLSVSVNANNQLSSTGFVYDAAGNLMFTPAPGSAGYTYNAESEITQADTNSITNYLYDGDGNRLEKSAAPNGVYKIYWYGAGTEILDESDGSGNFTNEYVFFGGKRIAMRTVSTGTIYYYEEDMLGSSRTIVQAGGTSPCYDADFYPFGGERVVTNTCSQNYKFEGKERDTETNNDDFGARYYSSQYGRWLSADWSSVPAPVPYANLSNPQTLNLYAMVSDNPESFADLDGHCLIDFDCTWTVWGFNQIQVQGGNNKTTDSSATSQNKPANSGVAPAQSQQTGNQQAQQAANNHTKQQGADYDAFMKAAKMPVDSSQVMLVTNVKTDVPKVLVGPTADVTLTLSDAKSLKPVVDTPKDIQAVEYVFQGSGGPSSNQANSKQFVDTISAGSTKGGVIGQIYLVDGKRVATAIKTQAGTVAVSNVNVLRTSPTSVTYNGFTLAQRPQGP